MEWCISTVTLNPIIRRCYMNVKCKYVGMLPDGTVTDLLPYYIKGIITLNEMNEAIQRMWDNSVKINPDKVNFSELVEVDNG